MGNSGRGKGLAIDFESYGAQQFKFEASKGRSFAEIMVTGPPDTGKMVILLNVTGQKPTRMNAGLMTWGFTL